MTTQTMEASPVRLARLAGFLYFLVVPLGIFGALYVPSQLIVSGDAAATASNIAGAELLFRLGLVSNLLAALTLIPVVLLLHKLLKPVDGTMSRLMMVFLLTGVPISMLSSAASFGALSIIGQPEMLSAFAPEQAQSMAMFFLRLDDRGGTIASIFWGLWLFPLGWLVFKSGFMPRILGILLMIACFLYVISAFGIFLGVSLGLGMFGAVAEILFILWLLIKGVDAGQWEKRAAEAA